MDLSLLDKVLKGRFVPGSKVLDVGFGSGRNSFWFLNNGFDVFGIEPNEKAFEALHHRLIQEDKKPENFILGNLEELPYQNNGFDLVICNAVLHFAKNEKHFIEMFAELVRVLSPTGILFIRMTSDIGIQDKIKEGENGVYLLPDGSHRFLLTRKMLSDLMEIHSLKFIEPLKTVNVNDVRCMSTLVLTKSNNF